MKTYDNPEKQHDHTREEPDFPPVAEDTNELLKQFAPHFATDYRQFKEDFNEWLLNEGKIPEKNEGYAEKTTRATHYRIEQAYRWLWDQKEEYIKEFTPEYATELIEFVAYKTPHPDSVAYHYEKSLKRLFSYYREQHFNHVPEWEHGVTLQDTNSTNSNHQLDRFYPTELSSLYEAALGYSSVKAYNNKQMSSEERQNLKRFVSQRLGIPMSEVGPEEFREANSWKRPSLIAVTCDTGLRPIEVENARTSWFNLQHGKMIVPMEDASKNDERWECDLQSKTVDAVRNWLQERQALDLYTDTDAMWVTRQGNSYGSSSLNRLLDTLIERAEIDTSARDLAWYSIRHGVATMWAEEQGIYSARNQLRHKDIETTLRYTRKGSNSAKETPSMW